MPTDRITDAERHQWVVNDEGLYTMQHESRQPMRTFIREHREQIDQVIRNVTSGTKRAHYLRYGA